MENLTANINSKLVAYGFESFEFVFEATVKLFGHAAILIPYTLIYFLIFPILCFTKIWKYFPGPLTIFYRLMLLSVIDFCISAFLSI